MEDSVILTIAALLLIGYVVLYISGRKYLETFQGDRFNTDGSPKTSAKAFQSMPENRATELHPDEYEISAVFQNQGSREASQQQISDAMTSKMFCLRKRQSTTSGANNNFSIS